MWITTNTRPDMSAKVGISEQNVSQPTYRHLSMLQPVTLEIIHTAELSLTLGGNQGFQSWYM